jgi:hypothetical protein
MTIGLVIVANAVLGQSNLPPAVQADLLRDRVYAQAKANDPDAVLASIDKYQELVTSYKLEFPLPLRWIEAKAAHEAGDPIRAEAALGEFLSKTDRNSDKYKEALALYPQYQEAAEIAKRQEADARRASLATRVPEMLAQINADVVTIPAEKIAAIPMSGFGLHTCIDSDYSCEIQGEGRRRELAPRQMNMHGFDITKHLVSNFWWDVFAADTGRPAAHHFGASDADPVRVEATQSGLRDVQNFIAWVSKSTGRIWRLPSEAEIESVRLGHSRDDRRGSLAFSVVFYTTPDEKNPGSENGYELGGDVGGVPLVELVGDCWHVAFDGLKATQLDNLPHPYSSAPVDERTWTDACDSSESTVLSDSPFGSPNPLSIRRFPFSFWIRDKDGAYGNNVKWFLQFHLARDN